MSITTFVPTRSAGIKSGVNCTREVQVQCFRDRPHEQSFAEAGDAFEQHLAAGNQRAERAFDNVVLSDDDFADLPPQGEEIGPELIELILNSFHAHGGLARVSTRKLRYDSFCIQHGWTKRASEIARPINKKLIIALGEKANDENNSRLDCNARKVSCVGATPSLV